MATSAGATAEASAAADPTSNDPESTVTAPSSSRRPNLLPIVLAVLILASAIVVGLLGWRVHRDAQANQDQADALAAARTGVGLVLSFDPANLDAELASARKAVSGNFAAQFDQLATAVIVPATRQVGLTTKAEVTRAAVIETRADQVDVLALVRQATASKAQPTPQAATNQVKVTMTQADGKWLISNMEPL
jgi:Mce-associated membrane protein